MSNLYQVFISAPPEVVRQACDSLAEKQAAGDQVEEVAVIPAEGGCFLVTRSSADSNLWLSLLPVVGRNASLEREMEQIKQDAETTAVNP
jgi:hypothetical protein